MRPSVLDQIRSSAKAAPDRLAVADGIRALTYAQLDTAARAAATELRARGVGAGDRVAVRLPTSTNALVIALACFWLGAVFVPLSPGDPPLRLAEILADCEPAVLVRKAGDDGEIPAGPALVRAEALSLPGAPAAPDLPAPACTGPAYCIYTSGTTGKPKGVVVGHESFAHENAATVEVLGLGPSTRAMCISAIHFDGSFGTLFTVPAAGGYLRIFRREPMVLPRAFARAVLEDGIDLVSCSPSFLRLLVASAALRGLVGSRLSTVSFGGEASSASHLQAFRAAVPDVRLFNRYGPTETVVAVATHEVRDEELAAGAVPLGRPHPGVFFHLLDEHGRPVEGDGATGELYVGGAQLMEGYWRDPALTAAVLRDDVVPGERVYRTGDLARRDPSGLYHYQGRADRVVKRTGVRISLDEVEAALRQLPGVTEAACLLREHGEDDYLVALVAAAPDVTAEHLVARLAERLPRSMMPDRVELVDAFPLTERGKLDYRALSVGAASV